MLVRFPNIISVDPTPFVASEYEPTLPSEPEDKVIMSRHTMSHPDNVGMPFYTLLVVVAYMCYFLLRGSRNANNSLSLSLSLWCVCMCVCVYALQDPLAHRKIEVGVENVIRWREVRDENGNIVVRMSVMRNDWVYYCPLEVL